MIYTIHSPDTDTYLVNVLFTVTNKTTSSNTSNVWLSGVLVAAAVVVLLVKETKLCFVSG
jgi:hypothetical protein